MMSFYVILADRLLFVYEHNNLISYTENETILHKGASFKRIHLPS